VILGENTAEDSSAKDDHLDPLPKKLQDTVNARLKNDLILCIVIGKFEQLSFVTKHYTETIRYCCIFSTRQYSFHGTTT